MLTPDDRMPAAFIQYAADILGDTNKGLSGPQIVKVMAAYAVDFDVDIPHAQYPFPTGTPNKRTVLFKNLMAFSPKEQYQIIKELCEHSSLSIKPNPELKDLKIKLVTKYSHLASADASSEINQTLIEETRHWLDEYPQVLALYNGALQKYDHGAFQRNLLDDLRLALEKLLHQVLGNSKSLENQTKFLGQFIKERHGSKEFSNMFERLVDYYAKYQNSYVKHDNAVIEEEIEFIFEIASSFMKHLVRMAGK